MIPPAFLQAWSTKAPWPDLRQVEQDLIICRALCDLFNAPALTGKIAFRGGTAIHKLVHADPWNDGAIGMRPDRRRLTAMDCGADSRRAASCRCLVRAPRMAQDEHAVRCGPMFG